MISSFFMVQGPAPTPFHGYPGIFLRYGQQKDKEKDQIAGPAPFCMPTTVPLAVASLQSSVSLL